MLDIQYEIPSRSYFLWTAIPSLFAATVAKVKEELSLVQYFASTTDLWSSHGMVHYMSYIVHFINSSGNSKQDVFLHAQFIPQDHTGENMAEVMGYTLSSWNLSSNRQICVTTDSGSNIINAANRLSGQD